MKRKLALFLLALLLLSSLGAYLHFVNKISNINNGLSNNLHSNDSEITILTPENKTYTAPMNGYYPATYGLENDADTVVPHEWIDYSGSGCTVQVISELGGHNKVIELYDSNANGAGVRNDLLPGRSSGTIEWWWRQSTNARWSNFWLYDPVNPLVIVSLTNAGQIRIGNSTDYQTLRAYTSSTWYHMRVDFECGSGEYKGLAPDTAYVYINEIRYGPYGFSNYGSAADNVRFQTESTLSNYYLYIDAISYSWDPNYQIGNNLDEGLLLNFQNSTTLNWIGYSLDGELNKTILGVSAIKMPDEGHHFIQIYGNNTSGTIFESGIRYFSYYYINLITPENKTYTEPMSGYYPATYGFENDADTAVPHEWIDYSGSGCTAQVISELGSHNKVIELYDSNVNGAGVRNDLLPGRSSGTIEWWWRQSSNARWGNFWLYDPVNPLVIVSLTNAGQIRIGNSTDYQTLRAYSSSTWYHMRVDFECGSGEYQGLAPDTAYVYINEIRYGPYGFSNYGSAADNVRFQTESTLSNYYLYVDAISYSWDPNYQIGNNLNEGLLLSFEHGPNLDWIGYCLDGQPNRTVLGNTTTPFPSEGCHTIHLFANDTLGFDHQSSKRHFCVDLSAPVISIIFPGNNDYYGSVAPIFNLSITDVSLDAIWYNLNGSATNLTSSGLTDSIDQAEWSSFNDGPLTIRFYANDSHGRISFSEILIHKDATIPIVIVNQPLDLEVCTTPPIFNLTIIETNVESRWYTIDDEIEMHYFVNPIGSINPSAWVALPNGPVTIRFYVKDLAGNQVFQEITVIKQASVIPPAIPGYNLFIILGLFSLVSLILIYNKKKF